MCKRNTTLFIRIMNCFKNLYSDINVCFNDGGGGGGGGDDDDDNNNNNNRVTNCCTRHTRIRRAIPIHQQNSWLLLHYIKTTIYTEDNNGYSSLQIRRHGTVINTGLFISPSGTSELDCATTKKDRAERSISIGTESLKGFFFFVLGALAYLQVPPLGGSRDEKYRAQ